MGVSFWHPWREVFMCLDPATGHRLRGRVLSLVVALFSTVARLLSSMKCMTSCFALGQLPLQFCWGTLSPWRVGPFIIRASVQAGRCSSAGTCLRSAFGCGWRRVFAPGLRWLIHSLGLVLSVYDTHVMCLFLHVEIHMHHPFKRLLERIILSIQIQIQIGNTFQSNFASILVLLLIWCSDYLHNTDTEFDGELDNFVT